MEFSVTTMALEGSVSNKRTLKTIEFGISSHQKLCQKQKSLKEFLSKTMKKKVFQTAKGETRKDYKGQGVVLGDKSSHHQTAEHIFCLCIHGAEGCHAAAAEWEGRPGFKRVPVRMIRS